ncbi:MAG TPA: polysaccharide biosynthesis C-terminal domain-containing protein [Ensifer sp.]|nr:polysaccharide biosynthesis C-terminal domain-containing protein [Ensifer sp.]
MKPANNGIVKNSVLNAAAGLALLLTGFVSSVIVARLLGPEANGMIAFSLWMVVTGSLIAELGTGISMLRILPQLAARGYDSEARRGFGSFLAWPVTAATLWLAVAATVWLHYEGHSHGLASTPVIALLTGGLFIVQSLGSFAKNYLIGEQQLGFFFRVSSLSAVVQVAGVGVGAWYWGIEGALAGYALGQIPLFLTTLNVLRKRPDSCGMEPRRIASTSFLIVIEFIITAIFLARPEIVFLQEFRSSEAVGYYAVATSLANLALQLPIQLTGSLVPYYAAHSEKNGALSSDLLVTVMRNFAYLTLPMSFGLAAVAEPLVTGIYGPAYREAGIIVAILAAGVPAAVFLQLCTQYVFSMDRQDIRLRTTVVGACVMAAGLFAAVPFLGGEGAAAMRNLTLVIMGAFIMRYIPKSGSNSGIVLRILRIAAAALVTAALAYAATRILPGILGVVAGIIAGAVAYVPALRIMRAIDPADRTVLTGLSGRVPLRVRPFYIRLVNIAAPQTGEVELP